MSTEDSALLSESAPLSETAPRSESAPLYIVTMLGTGNYRPATYRWQHHEFCTELFPEALAHWLQPSHMCVLTTSAVEQNTIHEHWRQLQQRLADVCPLQAVSIPDGRSELELWAVFSKLVDALPPGCRLVLDVTHGFRSLPMVSLMAALYLRLSGRVQVERLLYGAYEARDEQSAIAPVFDLTPFLDMAAWMSAADQFVQTGNGTTFAALLRSAHTAAWKSDTVAAADRPRHLQTLGNSLENLSLALALTKPLDVAAAAGSLLAAVDRAAGDVAAWAPPFRAVLDRLQTQTAWMSASSLQAQRQLIGWYADHGQFVQAVTLAREWLVSVAVTCLNLDLQDFAARTKIVEPVLGWLSRNSGAAAADSCPEAQIAQLTAHPDSGPLLDAWNLVRQIRNDVAHCGMNDQPSPVGRLRERIQRIVLCLQDVQLPPHAEFGAARKSAT